MSEEEVDADLSKEVKGKPVKETPEETMEKVNAAADRLEAGNRELARLLAKQEAMAVEQTLGGEADAGNQKKTDEEKKAEAAKEYLKGTGLEDDAFPETNS